MNHTELIGQTLDDKYQIERELGRGGMGTVYLATHLGTERPVAIKIIAPQFMERPEFVERFRREAKAAGRLRHPNVVDVTDFGFASTAAGRVAYLVMEYLDGCTLGEILEEENNLPVDWTLDILEQVCSAVHEAHEQGIIHRDLKPDNIWLEPNQRGGYTVKVLDFGIAKLESQDPAESGELAVRPGGAAATFAGSAASATVAIPAAEPAVRDGSSATRIMEGGTVELPASRPDNGASDRETLIQPSKLGDDESGTLVLKSRADAVGDQESVSTRLISVEHQGEAENSSSVENSLISGSSASDLTRVGSVLGTPLYMSPEQCRGDRLDPRSDIYSLGVIAYQMLSGDTPFKGDFTRVMESHKFIPPPPLNAKKVRKKLKRVITGALEKDPERRPQTAEAFASALRSRSEGIFGLLRRAGMIYTEHIQKFLGLSAFFFLPMMFMTAMLVTLSFLRASETIPSGVAAIAIGVLGTLNSLITAFCAYLIIGTITWVVAQRLAVPLRPIKLRSALIEARKKWKTFLGLGISSTFLPVVAACVMFAAGFAVPMLVLWLVLGFTTVSVGISLFFGAVLGLMTFFVISVWLMLVSPVVMMENARGLTAFRRSKQLIDRSFVTSLAAYITMFLIPLVAAGLLSFTINMTARAIENRPPQTQTTAAAEASTNPSAPPPPAVEPAEREPSINFGFGRGRNAALKQKKDMSERLKDTFLEMLLQILLLPIQIIVISFTAIIVALLYLKTRQAGGESLEDLLSKFEDVDKPRTKWQERVRQRLIQSGRITSRS
jgi:serine/threonine protein kinase